MKQAKLCPATSASTGRRDPPLPPGRWRKPRTWRELMEHAAETRVSDLEARSRVDLNRRVSVLEAWARSTDEVLNLIVEAERRPSADDNKYCTLRDLRAVMDSIQVMLRRELDRE